MAMASTSCRKQSEVQLPYRVHNTFIDFLNQKPSEETCELIQSSKQRSRSEGVASRDRSDSRFFSEDCESAGGDDHGLRYLRVLPQAAMPLEKECGRCLSVKSTSTLSLDVSTNPSTPRRELRRYRSDSSGGSDLDRSTSLLADLSEPCMSPALSGMSSQGRARWADLEEPSDEEETWNYWTEQPKMQHAFSGIVTATSGMEREPIACHAHSDNCYYNNSNNGYDLSGSVCNDDDADDYQNDESACTVMIKNLWCKCSGAMLAEIIDRAGLRGQHRHVYVPMRQSNMRAATNRGFGFVTFNNPLEVKRCFEKLDGKLVRFGTVTREIHVALAHRQGESSGRRSPCPIAWGRV